MESGLPSNVCFDLPMSPLRWSSSSHSSLLVTWICHWKLSTRFLPAAILRRAATPPDAFSIADGSEWTKCNGNASVNQMGSIQLTQAEATGSLRILGSTEWRRTRMWRMFHASIKRRRRAFLIRSCHDQDHRRGGGEVKRWRLLSIHIPMIWNSYRGAKNILRDEYPHFFCFCFV